MKLIYVKHCFVFFVRILRPIVSHVLWGMMKWRNVACRREIYGASKVSSDTALVLYQYLDIAWGGGGGVRFWPAQIQCNVNNYNFGSRFGVQLPGMSSDALKYFRFRLGPLHPCNQHCFAWVILTSLSCYPTTMSHSRPVVVACCINIIIARLLCLVLWIFRLHMEHYKISHETKHGAISVRQ